MEPARQPTKSSWTSMYTILAFVAVGGIYLMIAPSVLHRPDLAFLKPIGQLIVFGVAPTVIILRRLDEGTLTRGWLLFILVLYTAMGAAAGISVYETFAS